MFISNEFQILGIYCWPENHTLRSMASKQELVNEILVKVRLNDLDERATNHASETWGARQTLSALQRAVLGVLTTTLLIEVLSS